MVVIGLFSPCAYTGRKSVCASRLEASQQRLPGVTIEETPVIEASCVQQQVAATQTEPLSTFCAQSQTDHSARIVTQNQDNSQFLQTEKSRLEQVICSLQLTKERLHNNDGPVRFYHHLEVLMAIFDHVSAPVTECTHSSLPLFQQYLINLMKLHLNLKDQDIAYHSGGISQFTVSRKWVDIMYISLY